MDRIVIRQSMIKQLRLALIGALLLARMGYSFVESHLFFNVLGIAFIAVGGVYLAFVIYRMIKPKDILIIDSDGFTDNSSPSSPGFVPWSVVEDIHIAKVLKRQYIAVKINPSYYEQMSNQKKAMAKFNTSIGGVANISLYSTNKKNDEVLSIMQEYLRAYQL